MTFAFAKKQHLAQREAIAALSSRGKVLFKYPIKAYWLPNGNPPKADVPADGVAITNTGAPGCARYVFSVPKREFKRAVKRNLLKRRMREAVRLNQAECLGDLCADYLLVYISKEICDYSVIEAAVRHILSKSKKLDPTFGSELHKGMADKSTSHK